MPVLSDRQISRLYKMIDETLQVFDQHEIIHFAVAGTLLGAVRHGGIIPWDWDADIGTLASAAEINRLAPALHDKGYKLKKNNIFGFKIFDDDNEDVWVDIFLMERMQKSKKCIKNA